MRRHVLDMRGLDKFETAALDERNVAALELEFEIERMKARTKQHRDFRELDAFLAKFQDALRDEARLHVLVLGADQHGSKSALALGEQSLGVFLAGARNQIVGDVEDALQRAVIFLELDDPCAGKN